MTYKMLSPEGECISYYLSVHVLTSIASVANDLYIIKLLYNSTVSMVMVNSYILPRCAVADIKR